MPVSLNGSKEPVASFAPVQITQKHKNDYQKLLEISVENPKFNDRVVTSIAQKCYQENEQKKLGWGHSIKKGVACTTAYVVPPITITSLAYYYRYEIMTAFSDLAIDAAWSIGSNMDLKTACEAALGFGTSYVVNDQLDKRMGIRPSALVAHYLTHLFGAAVNKLSDATCNTVAKSYHRQEQAVEELTKRNNKEIAHSLKQKWNAIAVDVKEGFEKAETIEEQFKIESQLKDFSANKLPAIINRSFPSVGITGADAASILEPFNEVVSGISVSLDLDMSKSAKAEAYNYGLLVNLPAEKGIAHCVPTVVQDYLEEAKLYNLGWSYTAKSVVSAAFTGALTAVSVPVTAALAFKAAQLAGYAKPQAFSDLPVQYGAATGLAALTTAGTLVKRKWSLYQKTLAESQEKLRENMDKAQMSLAKAFNDVAKNLKIEDKATVLARLPEWEKEIRKYPELDAENALLALKAKLGLSIN